VRVGSQRPRLVHLPPGRLSSAGADAVEFAASCGLFLDDWQAWCLDQMLAEDSDGRWCASQIALILPRQNGKNAVLEALELYAMYVLDERRIIHTAHLAKTAADHMRRMVELIRSNPDLDDITRIYYSNGKEAFERTDNGSRLEFITRGRKTARGGSPSRIVFDEALYLTDEQQNAIVPALSAQSMNAEGPPQFIFTSSAPLPESTVLHRVRQRGMSGDAGRLFFAEWSCDEDVVSTDRDAWWSCNPGMGIRISEEWVAENEAPPAMSEEGFRTERLGVVSAVDGGSGVLPAAKWAACEDRTSKCEAKGLALSVGPDSRFAAFAVSGPNGELSHVEVTSHEAGTAWVVETAVKASRALGLPVTVDPKSPTAAVLTELVAAGVDLVELTVVDFVKACAQLQDDVLNVRLRHIGQAPLNAAVAGCDVRPVGESWAFTQRTSTVDITPLLAVTLALSASRGEPEFAGGFHDLDDF
jgi:phage terminase large subunit-like protein